MAEMKEINGYTFFNETKHTSYSTTERSKLYHNGYKISEGLDRWINRPWYRYRYENAMKNAIYKLIHAREQIVKENFMEERGYKKFTTKRNEEFKPVLDADELIQEYRAVLAEL